MVRSAVHNALFNTLAVGTPFPCVQAACQQRKRRFPSKLPLACCVVAHNGRRKVQEMSGEAGDFNTIRGNFENRDANCDFFDRMTHVRFATEESLNEKNTLFCIVFQVHRIQFLAASPLRLCRGSLPRSSKPYNPMNSTWPVTLSRKEEARAERNEGKGHGKGQRMQKMKK